MLLKSPINETVKQIDDEINQIYDKFHQIQEILDFLHRRKIISIKTKSNFTISFINDLEAYHSCSIKDFDCSKHSDLERKTFYLLMKNLSERARNIMEKPHETR